MSQKITLNIMIINNKKHQVRWSEENKAILADHYFSGGTSMVMSLIPGASKESVKSAAREFGIKYDKKFSYHHKLKPLLEETNFNYYWLGFLMADGSFSVGGHSNLTCKISIQDQDHLTILANYLNVNVSNQKAAYYDNYKCNPSCSISISDSQNIIPIMNKFNITKRKTENPPNLNCLNSKEKFLSFFIGFIDGDGCITQNNKNVANMMRIQCHGNWLNNFKEISEKLYFYCQIKSTFYIDNHGYAKFLIYRFNNLKKLKLELLNLTVPYLSRKWNKIDHFRADDFYIDENEKLFLQYWNENLTLNEIASKFNCSLTPVHKMKKKLNLKKYLINKNKYHDQ